MKWGTKQAVNLPTEALPGGMPIRANGTFQFKVGDYQMLIDKVAGVKKQYTIDEVRERVLSMLTSFFFAGLSARERICLTFRQMQWRFLRES